MIIGVIALWLLLEHPEAGSSVSAAVDAAQTSGEGGAFLLALIAAGAFATGRAPRFVLDFPTPTHVPVSSSPAPVEAGEHAPPYFVLAYSQRAFEPPRPQQTPPPPLSIDLPKKYPTHDTSPRGPPAAC